MSAIWKSKSRLVRGLLGTGPPDPTLKSASPSLPQSSIWHRFNIDSTLIRHRFRDLTLFRCRINVESMLNRCQIDPCGGEGEVDSRVGSVGSAPIMNPHKGRQKWETDFYPVRVQGKKRPKYRYWFSRLRVKGGSLPFKGKMCSSSQTDIYPVQSWSLEMP